MPENVDELCASFSVYVDIQGDRVVEDRRLNIAARLMGDSYDVLSEMEASDVASILSGLVGVSNISAALRLREAVEAEDTLDAVLVGNNLCLTTKNPSHQPLINTLATTHPAFYAKLAAYLLTGTQEPTIGRFFWKPTVTAARHAAEIAQPKTENQEESNNIPEDDEPGGFRANPDKNFLDDVDDDMGDE